MRWSVRLILIVAVIAIFAAVACVYRGITASVHAEHVLHAALLTTQLLEEHIVERNGEWPRSWSDLETLPRREWAMFAWPADSRDVQRYVTVDFSADLQRLASQTIDDFDAVRPIGPYYDFKHRWQVESLLITIREKTER